jgi:peptide/nickel transport system permease protein
MGFRGYVIKRVASAVAILFVVMTVNFVVFRVLTPFDPTSLILNPRMKPETKAELRNEWGLNESLFIQYGKYLINMLTWNYGREFNQDLTPIAPTMVWRLQNTVFLMGAALLGEILIGIPAGMLASSRRGGKADVAIIGTGLFTWGVPAFFIQLIFLLVFCNFAVYYLGFPLIPSTGVVSNPPPTDRLMFLLDVAHHAIAPIVTLIIAGFGSWALYIRNMMIDTLTEDYITTARAKGVKNRDVLWRHAFRSLLPPVATIIALSIPGIVTGAIITESIFGWPGIGTWYINALTNNNHPVAQAVLYNYAVLVIGANLVCDLLYGFLDPRIRVGQRR